MGVLDTTYTFTATDVVTSAKLNNVIDQTTFTATAVTGATLAVSASGQLRVNTITSNEMGSSSVTSTALATNSVTTEKILDGNVTQIKTNNSLVPTGAIMAFGMNSVPTGWLECNGQSTSGYTALAALVGANVPDLRGYFVRGWDNSRGVDNGRVFASAQDDQFKAHTHGGVPLLNGDDDRGDSFSNFNINSIGNTYSAGGTETRPKNIALLYCIKY